jgi:hypothetical protein
MNIGAMKMRGAKISARTVLICGSCFQNASRTPANNFQLRRVLENRRSGTGVQLRAMAQHHQHGVGKIFSVHAQGLAQCQAARKPVLHFFRKLLTSPAS